MRLAIGFLLLGIISGCAQIGSNIKRDFKSEGLLDDGLIYISATTEPDDSVYPAFTDLDITKLSINKVIAQVRTHTDDSWGAPESDFDDAFGNVFAIKVPQGRYALTRWNIKDGYKQIIYDPLPPIEFSVEAGKAVYLGNFNVHPTTGKNVFTMTMVFGANVEFRDREEKDLDAIYKRFPGLKNVPVTKQIAEKQNE